MIPGVEAFKCKGDPSSVSQNWEKWKKSFEYFVTASGIAEPARRKALLLHMAGRETQLVYETLGLAADATYDQAMTALHTHFTVTKNVPFELSVFHRAKQEKEESIEQYVTKLRKLSEFCEYGDQRENEIRDQLIASCSSSRFRKKMLETADLTLSH